MGPSAHAADLSFQRWSGIFRETQYLLPPISIPACFPPLWPAGLWEALAVWSGWPGTTLLPLHSYLRSEK